MPARELVPDDGLSAVAQSSPRSVLLRVRRDVVAFLEDLGNRYRPERGAGAIGFSLQVPYPVGSVGQYLQSLVLSLSEQLADAEAARDAAQSASLAAIVAAAGLTSGIVGHATKALLDADLAHAAGVVGYVSNDPTATNNGFYLKSGVAGAGAWTASSYSRLALAEGRLTTVEGLAQATEADLGDAVKQVADDRIWYTDKWGRAAAYIDSDGSLVIAQARPQAVAWGEDLVAEAAAAGPYLKAIEDQWGRIAFGVRTTGQVELGAMAAQDVTSARMSAERASMGVLVAGVVRTDTGSVTPLPDIFGFPAYGQSWTVGFDSQPAISTTQRFANVMFNGGVRSQSIGDDPAVVYASFVPLVERNDAGTPGFPSYLCGETFCASQTDSFCERLRDENPQSVPLSGFQMFSSCPGEGSKRVEELSKGTVYYTRLMTQIQYAFDLAQVAGKTFSVPAVSWVQNTANAGFAVDGGTAAYPALLEQLRADLDADIKAITGQAETVVLITWQMFPDGNDAANSAAKVYARHVKAADTYPHIYCVGGSYFLDQDSTAAGAVHLKNESQRWLGAQLGLVAKRVVVDGEHWRPVQPLAVKKAGRIVTVRFHVPAGRLVFDTDRCALAENYGFNAYTSGGVELPISSVAIANRDTVRIVLAGAPPTGAVLRYASKGSQQGRLIGIRGNLRDTQGDFIQHLGLPLHNWAVCFEEPIL